jgi:hypothetical protein
MCLVSESDLESTPAEEDQLDILTTSTQSTYVVQNCSTKHRLATTTEMLTKSRNDEMDSGTAEHEETVIGVATTAGHSVTDYHTQGRTLNVLLYDNRPGPGGIVEYQCRGTLHMHNLVFLGGGVEKNN